MLSRKFKLECNYNHSADLERVPLLRTENNNPYSSINVMSNSDKVRASLLHKASNAVIIVGILQVIGSSASCAVVYPAPYWLLNITGIVSGVLALSSVKLKSLRLNISFLSLSLLKFIINLAVLLVVLKWKAITDSSGRTRAEIELAKIIPWKSNRFIASLFIEEILVLPLTVTVCWFWRSEFLHSAAKMPATNFSQETASNMAVQSCGSTKSPVTSTDTKPTATVSTKKESTTKPPAAKVVKVKQQPLRKLNPRLPLSLKPKVISSNTLPKSTAARKETAKRNAAETSTLIESELSRLKLEAATRKREKKSLFKVQRENMKNIFSKIANKPYLGSNHASAKKQLFKKSQSKGTLRSA